MFKIIRTAALSVILGLGAFAAMPAATAQAQSGGVYLGFGNQGPGVGFHFNDRGRHDYRDRGRGHNRGRDRGCSAREAVSKAEQMGLRRARVVGENRRVVRVEGRDRRGRTVITFANAHRCPVLR